MYIYICALCVRMTCKLGEPKLDALVEITSAGPEKNVLFETCGAGGNPGLQPKTFSNQDAQKGFGNPKPVT